MHPSKCDLLGYLLGAVDAKERQQIEQELERHPELEEELMRLKETLQPIEELRAEQNVDISDEFPSNLSQRTCHLVASVPFENNIASKVHPQNSQTRIPLELGPIRSSWSVSDFIALAVCLAVISAILIPAISFSRYESRLTACKDNLAEIGLALANYQDMNQSIIPVSYTGNRGVAGIYAPTLMEAGLIEDPATFYCPGRGSGQTTNVAFIPQLDEIDRANCQQIREIQKRMGGHYSYTLGYILDGCYHSDRKLGRPCLVILADNACPNMSGRASAHHSGKGQNVLFGDLSVRFVSIDTSDPCFDVIYLNDNGITAAGVGPNDNVVAPSNTRPLPPFCQNVTLTTEH